VTVYTTAPEHIARRDIAKAMEGLDPNARRRVIERVKHEVPAILARHEDKHRAQHTCGPQRAAYDAWASVPFKLQRNDCSRIHKLREAIAKGLINDGVAPAKHEHRDAFDAWFDSHTFVVQHDFPAAFANAHITGNDEGRVMLPYQACTFEFRVNGRAVIFMCAGDEITGAPNKPLTFVQGDGPHWWIAPEGTERDRLDLFCWEHVYAIAMALDAEVVTHEVVRGPPKLNERRAKEGKPLLKDFHILKLHGRHVYAREAMGGTHRSPRLHFRRGHWRHYETHTAWVRWTLVGNPDLGFIDKQYAL
jgi:hypothetical protein